MHSARNAWTRDALASVAWLSVSAALAVPLYSFLTGPGVWTLRAAVVALWGLAAWRPSRALLWLAGLGPLAGAVQALAAGPHAGHLLLEALVLSACSGGALAAALRSSRQSLTLFECAACTFVAVVLASGIAQAPVEFLRAGETVSMGGVARLVRDYFDVAPSWPAAAQTMLLAEGVALAVFTRRVCVRHADLPPRLIAVLLVGGAAAAFLNIVRLFEVALRNPPVVETLARSIRTLRFNTQYGDLNAAGSFFAMLTILCANRVGLRTRHGRVYGGIYGLLLCGLWVSGSRVALAAAILGTAIVRGLPRVSAALGRLPGRRALGAAAVAGSLALVLILLTFPLSRHATFSHSLYTRIELMKAGGRMFLDYPLLGVGTSQFYARSPHYMSGALQEAFIDSLGRPVERENAHNQFVQILAELGLAGLAAFAALLATALRVNGQEEPRWRRGLLVALGGFLLTALAGHPLLTAMVAYPFWLLVGVAASGAPASVRRVVRGAAVAAAASIILLALTLPARWSYEMEEGELAGAGVGFSRWQRDEAGTRFRTIEGPAIFFVSAGLSRVTIPLKSPDTQPRHVDILLDGRRAAGVLVPPGLWVDVPLLLPNPGDRQAARRIDIVVRAGEQAAVGVDRRLLVGRPSEFSR